ncbi:MAG: glycosyltransferase [Flavimaricola sp.]|nr:glycosyltransferase [Flavimaricola sp.]
MMDVPATFNGRVIMVHDSCVARGGATAMALLATRLLRERDVSVVFVTGDTGENEYLRSHGVEVVSFGGTPLLQGSRIATARNGLWNSRARAFLAHWIAQNGRPDDVWHLHNWSQIWSPSIFSALAPVMRRLVVHAHDYFNACPNGTFYDYQLEEVCRRVPLSASCLTTNCDRRSALQKVWRSGRQALLGRTFTTADAPPLLLIHPGMAPAFLRSGFCADRMPVLRNPSTPFTDKRIAAEHNKTLVYIGRLDQEKGAVQLARAAAMAKVPLKVIGSGPEEAAIALANPEAQLTGWQNHTQIREHVAGARALIMPSLYPEPFGLVAVEAMGSGLPVVASHTALLAPEIVASGSGWSVDVRDVDGLSNILRTVADAPARDIAEKSLNAFSSSRLLASTPEAWCDELLGIYRRAQGNRRADGRSE